MASLWKYMAVRWRRLFAITPEEKYPAVDNSQKEYREEFGGIVDQYLISYSSERDEKPDGYHRIVYIDADNDIQWQVEKEDKLAEENCYNYVKERTYLLPWYLSTILSNTRWGNKSTNCRNTYLLIVGRILKFDLYAAKISPITSRRIFTI